MLFEKLIFNPQHNSVNTCQIQIIGRIHGVLGPIYCDQVWRTCDICDAKRIWREIASRSERHHFRGEYVRDNLCLLTYSVLLIADGWRANYAAIPYREVAESESRWGSSCADCNLKRVGFCQPIQGSVARAQQDVDSLVGLGCVLGRWYQEVGHLACCCGVKECVGVVGTRWTGVWSCPRSEVVEAWSYVQLIACDVVVLCSTILGVWFKRRTIWIGTCW